MLCSAAALQTASLKQPFHAVVVMGEMAANASCKPVPRLAIGVPDKHTCQTFYGFMSCMSKQGRVG